MFLFRQIQESNFTIIMYKAREEQSNVYGQGQGKWHGKAQKQHTDYVLQSWELSHLVFWVLIARQIDQCEMTTLLWESKT